LYVSSATLLIPSGGGGNLGGLSGIASQFGVTMPSSSGADLSSPSLYPELLGSRVFAEKILDKRFYLKEFGKELSLLAILTHGNAPPKSGKDTLVTKALGTLDKIIGFDKGSTFSTINVTTSDPVFSKELAEVVLSELEALNRFYKSQTVNEKIVFISNRIAAVVDDLKSSEKRLKEFNERNRQISSPALLLEQSRLVRDVEIQKGIYLTLKQQLELSKIEEVQESSIVQVLDAPQIPLGPSNVNTKTSVLFSAIFGILFGIIIGFIRAYTNNDDIDERKKLRRVKHFIKKKTKDIVMDYRISGILSVLLFIGLPYYLGHESKNPIFFEKYSMLALIINTVYILVLLISSILFIVLLRKRKK